MASSKEFANFINEQLGELNIMIRPMMGEYLTYYNGKLFGGIYDDRLLLKKTENGKKLMKDADEVFPYEGSKTLMLVVEDLDNSDFLKELVIKTCEELPDTKRREKK